MNNIIHTRNFTVVDPNDRATLPQDSTIRVIGLVVPVPGSHYRKPALREGRVYCSVAETPLWMDIGKDASNPITCLVAWTPAITDSVTASQILQKFHSKSPPQPTGDQNHGSA